MRRHANCRFCDIVNGAYRYNGVDEPIAENGDFIAIASIGAMVPGWVLILPKTHYCSMKNLYKKNSFRRLANSILGKLSHPFKRVIAFEHGANMEGSSTGCGIDHAHLHIVPLDESLIGPMKASNLQWLRSYPSQLSSIVGNNEYLFYTEFNKDEIWNDPYCHLHILKNPISQYFRRLIGKQIGNINCSDYKAFPHVKIAKNTRDTLIQA